MKIVFLGENDWANTSNRIARAINARAGEMSARAVTVKPHIYGYAEDVVIARDGEDVARDAISGADWIISSGDGNYDALTDLITRFGLRSGTFRLATRHAGSAFRNNPAKYQQLDSEWGFERRFVACDLYRFVIDDPRARVFIQPQEHIADRILVSDSPLRFCHAPSSRATKGTASILSVIASLQSDGHRFAFDLIEKVSFAECNSRMKRNHLLIDQLQFDIGGFGAAAMEALASGLAVVSFFGKVVGEVERWIPIPPIVNVDSDLKLRETLLRFINDQEYFAHLRRRSLAWASQHLTPQFTYEYWRRCLDAG